MNALYSEIASVATEVISEFGASVVFSKTVASGTGTMQYPASIVIVERVDSVLPGSNLIIGDWKCLATPSQNYDIGDRVTISGFGRMIIADIEQIAPGGTSVAVWVWLRLG